LPVLLLALIVADLAVAGWLLLSARAAARPRPARVVAVALLLCAGFLLSLDGLPGPASPDVPHPLAPAEDAART
jgi:hypothetical protein